MSCNCGCHSDKPPATGWRRHLPLIIAALLVGALVGGAVLKDGATGRNPSQSKSQQTTAASPDPQTKSATTP